MPKTIITMTKLPFENEQHSLRPPLHPLPSPPLLTHNAYLETLNYFSPNHLITILFTSVLVHIIPLFYLLWMNVLTLLKINNIYFHSNDECNNNNISPCVFGKDRMIRLYKGQPTMNEGGQSTLEAISTLEWFSTQNHEKVTI
jgi:hypothetical protein